MFKEVSNKFTVIFVTTLCFLFAFILSVGNITGNTIYNGVSYRISLIGAVFFLSGICAAFYLIKNK